MKTDSLRKDENVKQFVDCARKFCTLVENCNDFELSDFEEKSLSLLSKLYHLAIELPFPALVNDDLQIDSVTVKQRKKIYSEINDLFGKNHIYKMIYDPDQNDDEIVHAMLGDDFSDIYSDVKNSLVIFDKNDTNSINEAVWQWKNDFMSHWGSHALNIISTIHKRHY